MRLVHSFIIINLIGILFTPTKIFAEGKIFQATNLLYTSKDQLQDLIYSKIIDENNLDNYKSCLCLTAHYNYLILDLENFLNPTTFCKMYKYDGKL
jgi:hypothetical protein